MKDQRQTGHKGRRMSVNDYYASVVYSILLISSGVSEFMGMRRKILNIDCTAAANVFQDIDGCS